MNKKFGFVILHYMALEMTKECIDKILSLFSVNETQIVIVDNASSNGSGKVLKDSYKNNENVTVLLNHANLGFAQGNNIGYLYLKANYNCNFIIIMNNDILIDDSNWLLKIEEIYNRTKFAVLGPEIYSPKANELQNPVYRYDRKNLYGLDTVDVEKMQCAFKNSEDRYTYFKLRHIAKILLTPVLWPFYIKRKKSQLSQNVTKQEELFSVPTEMENVVLHGACYIFSQEFIQKRSLAFNPATFLYFEEDILHRECIRDGLKMLYSSKLKVTHLEDVSTNVAIKKNAKRIRMKNRNLIKSTKVFLELE